MCLNFFIVAAPPDKQYMEEETLGQIMSLHPPPWQDTWLRMFYDLFDILPEEGQTSMNILLIGQFVMP